MLIGVLSLSGKQSRSELGSEDRLDREPAWFSSSSQHEVNTITRARSLPPVLPKSSLHRFTLLLFCLGASQPSRMKQLNIKGNLTYLSKYFKASKNVSGLLSSSLGQKSRWYCVWHENKKYLFIYYFGFPALCTDVGDLLHLLFHLLLCNIVDSSSD